jgi:hypothetical protein
MFFFKKTVLALIIKPFETRSILLVFCANAEWLWNVVWKHCTDYLGVLFFIWNLLKNFQKKFSKIHVHYYLGDLLTKIFLRVNSAQDDYSTFLLVWLVIKFQK